jgi:hypothetical protein
VIPCRLPVGGMMGLHAESVELALLGLGQISRVAGGRYHGNRSEEDLRCRRRSQPNRLTRLASSPALTRTRTLGRQRLEPFCDHCLRRPRLCGGKPALQDLVLGLQDLDGGFKDVQTRRIVRDGRGVNADMTGRAPASRRPAMNALPPERAWRVAALWSAFARKLSLQRANRLRDRPES